jgi:hypothetical protein
MLLSSRSARREWRFQSATGHLCVVGYRAMAKEHQDSKQLSTIALNPEPGGG